MESRTNLNPIVMLNATIWHIVETGRAADVALCGLPLCDRCAHSRLKTVGREHVCPDCLRALDRQSQR